jgi:biotin operon repressor
VSVKLDRLFPDFPTDARGRALMRLSIALGVTPREAEILALLVKAECAPVEFAAERLGISSSTLKAHVWGLRRKGWAIISSLSVGYHLTAADSARIIEALK